MAAQQGFAYEENAAKALKPMGFVPKDFKPAGASHDQPDLYILKGKNKSGCELKITDASAGSLVLKFNPKTKKWGFDPESKNDPEKAFIMDVSESVNLFKLINSKWKDTPYKLDREYQDVSWKNTIGKLTPQARYDRDLKTFVELKGDIPASAIERYYNRKDTYYVNIGTHGFYLFGSSNPLKFTGVPVFSSSATAGWRARVQYKGSGNYQFTFEMNFRMRSKSPFNIAPITKTSVNIIESQIKIPT
jgi:hypothetical protein